MARQAKAEMKPLFQILRAALFGEPLVLDEKADYEAVYRELKLQAILPLTSSVYPSLPLPPALADQWKQDLLRHFYIGLTVRQEEKNLSDLFASAGIPSAILKGSAAALYYPGEVYRSYGDVDVLVSPDRFEEAAEKMEQNGYRRLTGLYDDPRNATFRKGKVSIELHRHFFHKDTRELDSILFEALPTAVRRETDDYSVTTLPDPENGLVLLEHLHIHLYGDLGLRQVIDWLMFVARVCDDAFWEKTFRPLAKRAGLETLAVTVTALGKKYFGLPASITWCDGAKDAVVDDLLRFFTESGNFGIKKQQRDRTIVNIVGRHRTPIEWLRHLQDTGMSHWKLAQKHKVFRPFAWLYQAFRYLVRGLKDNKFLSFLHSEQAAESKEKRKLYRDLDL